jgi:hypothetical protein
VRVGEEERGPRAPDIGTPALAHKEALRPQAGLPFASALAGAPRERHGAGVGPRQLRRRAACLRFAFALAAPDKEFARAALHSALAPHGTHSLLQQLQQLLGSTFGGSAT